MSRHYACCSQHCTCHSKIWPKICLPNSSSQTRFNFNAYHETLGSKPKYEMIHWSSPVFELGWPGLNRSRFSGSYLPRYLKSDEFIGFPLLLKKANNLQLHLKKHRIFFTCIQSNVNIFLQLYKHLTLQDIFLLQWTMLAIHHSPKRKCYVRFSRGLFTQPKI